MIFENVYEYYMFLGTEDALKSNFRDQLFFKVKGKVAEDCMDAYMFGFMMATGD